MGSSYHQPHSTELALLDPQASVLRCRQRLHVAMGGPSGSDEALCAAGQGAVRCRDAVQAALRRRELVGPDPTATLVVLSSQANRARPVKATEIARRWGYPSPPATS